jgi:hypothetical protein
VKNVAGTVSVSAVDSVVANDGIPVSMPFVAHVASGTNVLVQFTGNQSDTLIVSGTTVVYL